jgi:hypothetical protein
MTQITQITKIRRLEGRKISRLVIARSEATKLRRANEGSNLVLCGWYFEIASRPSAARNDPGLRIGSERGFSNPRIIINKRTLPHKKVYKLLYRQECLHYTSWGKPCEDRHSVPRSGTACPGRVQRAPVGYSCLSEIWRA